MKGLTPLFLETRQRRSRSPPNLAHMKGLAPLFLGIFGTFAFSWIGLTVIPTWQIGHLNPETDEEGTDIYPRPQSGMFTRGEHVYAANGCVYCHSQQVRADYIADDIERKWGNRRSAPRDYIFERPVFLGKMRMGQDLANIGARAPAPEESPAPAGAPQGAAVSSPPSSPASSPATAPAASPGTSPASAASPNASPPPGQPTGVASPSPGQMANTTPGGSSPAAPSAQTPGAPWPIQTAGLPPMYSAAWHHVHLYAPRSINPDSNMPCVPFPLRKTAHRRRTFCRGVATFAFRCATGRLGGCSHVRCKMCCGLFDGA